MTSAGKTILDLPEVDVAPARSHGLGGEAITELPTSGRVCWLCRDLPVVWCLLCLGLPLLVSARFGGWFFGLLVGSARAQVPQSIAGWWFVRLAESDKERKEVKSGNCSFACCTATHLKYSRLDILHTSITVAKDF